MASSSSSSSSSSNRISYHVFLSFRGPDVGMNFVSHLHEALNQRGVHTFIDREDLRKGEAILQVLVEAIEKSQIAVIIFSKDYASSRWCLDETAKIMECKEDGGLTVYPVFYNVEPNEVRTPRESYKEAMGKQAKKFGEDSAEVKRWKKALSDAGSLSGWVSTGRDEAKLIKEIVEKISAELGDHTSFIVAKHPVGINRQVVELKSMLNLESNDGVLMIGLWGEGGMGKTTLAKALYNAIFRRFDNSCFLASVREASNDSKRLIDLQETLLKEILLLERPSSVHKGISLLKNRLGKKKALLVIDDVDDSKQLDALAGKREWFWKGSKIIITTRDKQLLTSHGIKDDHIYRAKTLQDCEAHELFSKCAFLETDQPKIREDLVNDALRFAKGLPLALEVLGSHLCDKTEGEWESALKNYAKSHFSTISDVLELSYNGLEPYEKEMFLNIACFFKGQSKEYIMKVLDCGDFDPIIGVRVLVDKSLIIEEGKTLQMHELIQLMGMRIVQSESRGNPRRQSRLWLFNEVQNVLSGVMGTDAAEAIVLNLPKPKVIKIGPNAFTTMSSLRMLIMINVRSSFQDPVCLPDELRWFEWPGLPKFPSGSTNLVGLDMHKSNIQVVREQFKDFNNLKFINFSECQSMVCMPDLNYTPNLKELDLSWCTNLESVHESVAYHGKLQLLNLSGCSKLLQLPNVLRSENLQLLNLNHCSKLQKFPEIPDKIKDLRGLYLIGTSIKELPASIKNLVSLEEMDLTNCEKLAILPSSIYGLRNLEFLMLAGCTKLIKLPNKTGFPKLRFLNLPTGDRLLYRQQMSL